MSTTLRPIDGPDEAQLLRAIQTALKGLGFGSVEITVHNGQVVQIERKERIRLQAPARSTS
ncbi:sulfur starvation response protein OscA [Stutzerimonas urumqiensis]|uniref:sulfur starvation response protein OscA n=1 Tax=Stutzerimonas urumqiensis TaxID=638269 RepID=UPI000EB429AC|nr:sulfur starvation response protein OscA [Stutzerimonas urumqiensis]